MTNTPFTPEVGWDLLDKIRAEADRFAVVLSEWEGSPLRKVNPAGGQLAAAHMLTQFVKLLNPIGIKAHHVAGDAYEWAANNRNVMNDDPAADLPGTVRKSPLSDTSWVKLAYDQGAFPWRILGYTDGRQNRHTDSEVRGWEVLPPVAGSPADTRR